MKAEHVTADLPSPAPTPAEWTVPRAVSRETFAATLAKIEDEAHRGVLTVLAGAGRRTQDAVEAAAPRYSRTPVIACAIQASLA